MQIALGMSIKKESPTGIPSIERFYVYHHGRPFRDICGAFD